ncbi:unnamed protein product [Somion occarium]|uniref:AB hydrolase-1 domain-containing protein n=1 Tax=Somion occarium TaxID=3059160 RepID=A0ABP1E542_9APHY
MPTFTVDEGDVRFYYEDTGPPIDDPTEAYTTVIMLHGTFYHSAIFRRLIPHAKKFKLRLVLLNQRDYLGSTPHQEKDINALRSSDTDVQRSILREHGHQYVNFIVGIIGALSIPPLYIAEDGLLAGGISFVAWSSGNHVLFEFLSYMDILPEGRKNTLRTHLRSVVVYDPPMNVIGDRPPLFFREVGNRTSGFWSPFRDPAIPIAQKMGLFPLFASSHYTPVSELPSLHDAAIEDTFKLLHGRKMLDDPPATCSSMSEKDIEEVAIEGHLSPRTASFLFHVKPEIFSEHVRRSFTQLEKVDSIVPGESQELNSRFKITLVWCDRTAAECILGASTLVQMHDKMNEEGVPVRRLIVKKLENANHLVHWEEPERFMTFLAEQV